MESKFSLDILERLDKEGEFKVSRILTNPENKRYFESPDIKKLNLSDNEKVEMFFFIKKVVDENLANNKMSFKEIVDKRKFLNWKIERDAVTKSIIFSKEYNKKIKFIDNIKHIYDTEGYGLVLDVDLFKTDDERIAIALKYFFSIACKERKNFHGTWIYGKSGIGKSHLAIAFCNSLARTGYTTAFFSFQSLASKWISNDATDNRENIRIMKNVDVLFFDDFGITSGSKNPIWLYKDLLEVFEERSFNTQKPIFFTSNYGLTELKNILIKASNDQISVDRIFSRIEKNLGIIAKGKDFNVHESILNLSSSLIPDENIVVDEKNN